MLKQAAGHHNKIVFLMGVIKYTAAAELDMVIKKRWFYIADCKNLSFHWSLPNGHYYY